MSTQPELRASIEDLERFLRLFQAAETVRKVVSEFASMSAALETATAQLNSTRAQRVDEARALAAAQAELAEFRASAQAEQKAHVAELSKRTAECAEQVRVLTGQLEARKAQLKDVEDRLAEARRAARSIVEKGIAA